MGCGERGEVCGERGQVCGEMRGVVDTPGTQRQTTPGPKGRHPHGPTPPPSVETATEAGGTHPTGIHSCYVTSFTVSEDQMPMAFFGKDTGCLATLGEKVQFDAKKSSSKYYSLLR